MDRTRRRHVETDLIETERLRTPPRLPPIATSRVPRRPALVSTELVSVPSGAPVGAPSPASAGFAHVGRAGRVYEVGGGRADPVRAALFEGFQCLLGLDFATATQLLARAGEGGLAILDGGGAGEEAVRALRRRGVLPVVHHLAVAHGADAARTAARARVTELCVAAARKGFGGVLVDELRRAPEERDAIDVKKVIEGARAQAAHPSFSALLRGGDALALAHPWLVEHGLVSAIVFEGVSYRVNADGTSGARTSSRERRALDVRVATLRARFPALPLIALDHARDGRQADKARRRARGLGFDVAHVALDDAMCERLSALTTVGLREDDPTAPQS